MSRIARTRLTGASLLTGALIGFLTLTGCGAGQVAGTAGQVAAVTGSNVTVGSIAVRDAVIVFGEQVEGDAVYARGAAAPLSMTIVNQGADADRIVGASSPWASGVTVAGTRDVPGGRALVVEDGSGTRITLTGLLDDVRAGLSYEVVLTFERAGEVTLQVPVGGASEPREEPTE